MQKNEIDKLCSLIIKECQKQDSSCSSSPICSEGKAICSPVKKARAPVKKAQAPVKKARAPVKKAQAPVKKAQAPVKKAQAPVKKAQAPVKKAQALVKKAQAPVKKAQAPVKKAQALVPFKKAPSVFFRDSVASVKAIEDSPKVSFPVPKTPQNSIASMKAIEDSPKVSFPVPKTPQNSIASMKAIEQKKNVKEMVQDIEEKIMKEKNPSMSFLKSSIKQVESPLEQTPMIEELPVKLVEDYVENVFKKVNFKYRKCEDLEDYKDVLKKKCIKFLGYDSPDKTSRCVDERFKWLLRDNKALSKNLDILGCKY